MEVLRKWADLPEFLKKDEVYPYYTVLQRKRKSLVVKRFFDIIMSLILIAMLSPLMLGIAVWIKIDSKGPVFFRQVRVTQYGRRFKIFKFRTMLDGAQRMGNQITSEKDPRITKAGNRLRKIRLDELPQLFNILAGDMSFVGTRPEVPRYVKCYTGAMWATLLLPAGVTSDASIIYKDEDMLLKEAKNADEIYVNAVIPKKMKYNLRAIQNFSFFKDIKIMINTLIAVGNRK